MEIIWLGHSCFRIRGSHASIVTDPFSPDLGYPIGKHTARIITQSHSHPGHCHFQAIGGDPKVISGPGEYEIAGVLIIGIATFHDRERGEARGKNTVYLMDVDDVSVCHLGDLGHMLNTEQVEELGNVDVLLLPVGGVSTINATVAAEIMRQLEPKVVIPMHYQTEFLSHELDPVERFLREVGMKEVVSQPKISLTKASLPLSTQVVLLDCTGAKALNKNSND